MSDDDKLAAEQVVVFQRGIIVDRDGNVSDDSRIKPVKYEIAGSGYDSGACGYELQGRAKRGQ